jgi:hypothetical protein
MCCVLRVASPELVEGHESRSTFQLIINQPAVALWTDAVGAIIPAGELIVELDLHKPVVVTVDLLTDRAIEGRPKLIHTIEGSDVSGKDGCGQLLAGGWGNVFRDSAREPFLDKLILLVECKGGRHGTARKRNGL